mgnify:CR=1 FL=1
MKKGKLIYCILFFAICLCPSLGMLVTKQETSSENRQLSEFPSPENRGGEDQCGMALPGRRLFPGAFCVQK